MLSAFAQLSQAQSGIPSVPEANRGRPTVSTPATLTPIGYLQFENGALFAEDSTEFSKRIGIGQVTKVSVLPRLELFVQSEPLAMSRAKDRTAVHEGRGLRRCAKRALCWRRITPNCFDQLCSAGSHKCRPGARRWHFSPINFDSSK